MKVAEKHLRTIWPDARCKFVEIIDQTKLPFAFEIVRINSVAQMVQAIKSMQVRGAPLIGAAAAYGMALATLEDDSEANVLRAADAVIDQAERVVLSERDSLRILELLEQPPAPNARLMVAAHALPAQT